MRRKRMSIFKPPLFKDFEEKGEWWLPKYPDNKIVGTVSYKGYEDITLELLGSFFGHQHFMKRERFHPQIILGLTDHGEPLTLLENVEIHSGKSSRGGTGTVIYRTNYLFIGEHFNAPNEIQFNSCSLSYYFLEEWIGKLPFKTEAIVEEDKFVGEKAVYKQREGFKVKVPTIDATVSIWHGFGGSSGGFRKLVWTHTAYLTITPEKPQEFIWFRKVQFQLRNLLSILIGRPVYLKRASFFIEKPEVEDERDRREIVYLYFAQRTQQPSKRMHPMDMLVRLDDIEEKIATILEAWFSKAEKLEDVYQLFIGAMYGQNMYTHLHFLTLMQALETYHRSTRAGQYISEDDYQKVFAALLTAIPAGTESSLKASLKGRLKYGNEYSLRKRINLLLNELTEDCRMLITKEPDNFISSIIDTRNYLTHYDRSLKPDVLDTADLYNASLSLKIFLTILLLKELEIEEQKIVELLSRNDPVARESVRLVEYDEDRKSNETKQLDGV
jgi:ApeA N-terminal domain 1